jgi:hypothetical protein
MHLKQAPLPKMKTAYKPSFKGLDRQNRVVGRLSSDEHGLQARVPHGLVGGRVNTGACWRTLAYIRTLAILPDVGQLLLCPLACFGLGIADGHQVGAACQVCQLQDCK